MATGTKQIRLGKVEKFVEELETYIEVLTNLENDCHEAGDRVAYNTTRGRKMQTEFILSKLKEEFGL